MAKTKKPVIMAIDKEGMDKSIENARKYCHAHAIYKKFGNRVLYMENSTIPLYREVNNIDEQDSIYKVYNNDIKLQYKNYFENICPERLVYEEIPKGKNEYRPNFIEKYFTYNIPKVAKQKGYDSIPMKKDVFLTIQNSKNVFIKKDATQEDIDNYFRGSFYEIDFEHFYFQILYKDLNVIDKRFYEGWSFHKHKKLRNMFINIMSTEPKKEFFDHYAENYMTLKSYNHIYQRVADNIRAIAHNVLNKIVRDIPPHYVLAYNTDGVKVKKEVKDYVVDLFAETDYDNMTSMLFKISDEKYLKNNREIFAFR